MNMRKRVTTCHQSSRILKLQQNKNEPHASQQTRIKSRSTVRCVSNSTLIMASLLDRLKRLQTPVETEETTVNLSQYALAEMEDFKIDFGKTYLRRTYRSMWEEEQTYIQWFLSHYGKSAKPSHQIFTYYLECKIDQAETQVIPVKVTNQGPPSTLTNVASGKPSKNPGYLPPRSKAAPKAKPMAHEVPIDFGHITSDEEDMSWTVMAKEEQIQSLESRMTQMEGSINVIASHLEQLCTHQALMKTSGEIS